MGVVHRGTGIDEQVTLRIRVRSILLDEIAIGAAEQTPVEITQVVAGVVLTILGELGREAGKRRAMQTGHEAFDNRARVARVSRCARAIRDR